MRIAVYCGSRMGTDPVFEEVAKRFGHILGESGIDVVYGGGSVGLMGVIADAAMEAGSDVVGVIPEKLNKREVAHFGLSELHVVDDMHERKMKMIALADAFVSMPGGIGTMEEFFEAWSWEVIGYHKKPSALLNVSGYYDGLVSMLSMMAERGFVDEKTVGNLIVESDPEALVQRLQNT